MRDKIKEQRKALRKERRKEFSERRKRSGSVLAGLLLLCIGTVLLLRAFSVPLPGWLFTWPMILITFGLLIGAAHAFRDPGWVVICGVGTVFLLQKVWPAIPILHFIWPVVIIAVGLIIILAPRRHRHWREKWDSYRGETDDKHDWEKWMPKTPETPAVQTPATETPAVQTPATETPAVQTPTAETPFVETPATVISPVTESGAIKGDNWLDVVTIFGNVKKLVYSKNFKGGDIVSIFGGSEINLTHADFKGNIIIEMVQIFGGAKLIVPPHWQIRSEMVAVFGGIEDKRAPQNNYDEDKVVILNGTTFFGGIEIRSY